MPGVAGTAPSLPNAKGGWRVLNGDPFRQGHRRFMAAGKHARPSVPAAQARTRYGSTHQPAQGGLTSDQRDDFPLRIVIGLDVSGGRSKAGMTGELLNIAQTAADFADFPGRASYETSPAGMA